MSTLDSAAIDAALVVRLASDPELLALMPNGVYIDVAAQNATRYVLLSLIASLDIPVFGGRAIEDVHYQVKAVGRSTDHPDMRAAAARIDALLDDVPFLVAGYEWMEFAREERIDHNEPDESTPSILWHHRGGIYHGQFSAADPVPLERDHGDEPQATTDTQRG
jgi:hypothetical protein